MNLAPNRVAVYLTAIASIAGGLAPVVANMDLSSTAGIVVAVLAITAVVRKWLEGWQLYEARKAARGVAGDTGKPTTLR